MRRALVVADVAGLVLSFLIAEGVAATSVPPPGGHVPTSTELLLFIVTVPLWIVVAKLQGLYDHDEERTNHSTADELFGVFQLVTVGVWLFVVSAWLTGWVDVTSRKLLTFWFAAVILVPAARLGARAACRRTAAFVQNTVIVGAGEVGQLIARKLQHHPEYGLRLVGFVDGDPRERRLDMDGVPVLGSPSNIVEIAVRNDIERIIIAYTRESFEQQLAMVRDLRSLDVQIDLVPRLFDVVGPRVGVHTVEGMPLLGLPPTRYPRSSLALKRAGDVLVSATRRATEPPVRGEMAIAIRRDSPGPVFFRQTRVGRGGQTFTMLKFRTMREGHRPRTASRRMSRSMMNPALPAGQRAVQARPVGRRDRDGSLASQDEPRRTAPADQRSAGRHVAGRASPCLPDEVELFEPHHLDRFRGPAGDDRPLAGDGAGPRHLRRGARDGCRVCP